MKQFYRMIALAVLLVALTFPFLATGTSAVTERVIYISDTGTGDGSTPEKALGPTTVVPLNEWHEGDNIPKSNNHQNTAAEANMYWFCKSVADAYYKNSVLYQAAEKLADTGGRIVIVGDVKIGYAQSLSSASHYDRDFYMPSYSKQITVSGYDSSSRFIICEGAHVQLGGDTLFENLHIGSMLTPLGSQGCASANLSTNGAQNRNLCARGHKLVIGENVDTSNFDGSTSVSYYPSVSGASRFESTDYDVDVTINSGTWYNVYGLTRGIAANPSYAASGNIKLTINGGTFLDYICAGGRNSTYSVVGNVDLTITGGTFKKSIYVSGNKGCMYPDNVANVKVLGGTFESASSVYAYYKNSTIPLDFAPQVRLDMSSADLTPEVVNALTKNLLAQSIIYPVKYCTSASIIDQPNNDYAFVGGRFNAEGMKIGATFSIGGKTYNSEVDFSMDDPAFTFVFDNMTAGNNPITYKYGDVSFHNGTVSVLDIPSVSIIGAQIRTDGTAAQSLRFVAHVDKQYGEQINVTDYGFIALPAKSLYAPVLAFDTVYGANEITSFGTTFRPELGVIYNGDTYFAYSGVYPDLDLGDFGKDVSAVAYVKFTHAGDEYIVYSEKETRSVLGVANAAYASPDEREDAKTWIKTNVIDAYAAYTANKNALYNETVSNELRQKVVDYALELVTYEWSPGTTFSVGGQTFTAGTTYKGVPYIANAVRKATLEEFKHSVTDVTTTAGATRHVYIGPIADLDDEKYVRYDSPKTVLDDDDRQLVNFFAGTDYGAFIHAWNKVGTNSVWFTTLYSMLPGAGSGSRGAVAVGDYAYAGTNTETIIGNNSAQTMYDAYAQCKKGDILLAYTPTSRSLWMVTGDVTVVRNTDGSVNPDSSKMKITYIAGTMSSGSQYRVNVDRTFTETYNQKRIPITIPELASGLCTDTVTTLQDFDGAESIRTGHVVGNVRSNRSIISVKVDVEREGNSIYTREFFYNSASDLNVNYVDLKDFNISAPVSNFVEEKTYVLKVTSNVAGEGEKVLVEYEYTKPKIELGRYANYITVDIQGVDQREETIANMLEQAAYEWTPTVSFQLYGTSADPDSSTWQPNAYYKAGQLYKGVAYTNTRNTSAEFDEVLGTGSGVKSFDPLQYVDLSNLVTLPSLTTTQKKEYTGKDPDGLFNTLLVGSGSNQYYVLDWNRVMGNHCSAADANALQQTIRMASTGFRNNPAQLCLKLPWDSGFSYCESYMKTYGLNALCEMYALARKGDLLYRNSPGGGHTRLVYEDAHVEYNANGTINPSSSYVSCIEQTDTLESQKNSSFISQNGYDTTWWIDHHYSFNTMYSSNCMILTFADYVTGESENPYIGITRKADAESLLSGVYGSVESNFPLLMVRMKIFNSAGDLVKTSEFRQHEINTAKNFVSYRKYDLSGLYTKLAVGELASGSYTYVLDVEIGRGIFELDRVAFTK